MEPEEGQDYAVVQEMMGNGRLKALCSDGVTRVGRIRGSMRKYAGKVIIEKGDLILISFRDFEEDKVDVIAKYTADEVSTVLKSYEISEKLVKALTHSDFNNYGKTSAADDYVMFMNEDDQSNDSNVDNPNDLTKESSEDSLDVDAI